MLDFIHQASSIIKQTIIAFYFSRERLLVITGYEKNAHYNFPLLRIEQGFSNVPG